MVNLAVFQLMKLVRRHAALEIQERAVIEFCRRLVTCWKANMLRTWQLT